MIALRVSGDWDSFRSPLPSSASSNATWSSSRASPTSVASETGALTTVSAEIPLMFRMSLIANLGGAMMFIISASKVLCTVIRLTAGADSHIENFHDMTTSCRHVWTHRRCPSTPARSRREDDRPSWPGRHHHGQRMQIENTIRPSNATAAGSHRVTRERNVPIASKPCRSSLPGRRSYRGCRVLPPRRCASIGQIAGEPFLQRRQPQSTTRIDCSGNCDAQATPSVVGEPLARALITYSPTTFSSAARDRTGCPSSSSAATRRRTLSISL